jgi:hypothetical protein
MRLLSRALEKGFVGVGFLVGSEQGPALSCWEICPEVQCGLLMAERVLFAPQFDTQGKAKS